MKKIKIIISVIVFLSLGVFVFAQTQAINQEIIPEYKPTREIPEGMEEIQITGSAKLIVPKGAKTRKIGAQIIVEGTKEYISRRFFEMEKRLSAMEKREEDLLKEIEALKKILEEQEKMDKKN